MSVRKSTITANYRKILNESRGAEFVKVDLHVHTPASGDAQSKNKYNFKYNPKNPQIMDSARRLAQDIVDAAINKGLRIIAVTDHNSPSNVHRSELSKTWYQLLREEARSKDLLVLPGVEISTDDLHLLVILDPGEDGPGTDTIYRINFLLRDCKFLLKDYGNYAATGMSSLFDVLQYVEDLGTCCITIPAHIDGGRKAMLASYRGPSNIFNRLLNHNDLNAVEVVKHTTPANKKIGKEPVRKYFGRLRDKHRSPIAFIQDSDAHSVPKIGHRFTYVRMGRPDFWALRNALENPETRVRMRHEYTPDDGKTSILGIAYSTGGKWRYIAFNSNLNCIIGKKQTNKSTIIDLIIYGMGRFEEKNKQDEEELLRQKYAVNVFVTRGTDVICYSRDSSDTQPDIYRYDNGAFKPAAEPAHMEKPRKYNHEAIQELFTDSTKLMNFLDGHVFGSNKVKFYLEQRDKHLKEVKNKNFVDCDTDMRKLVDTCNKLHDERQKIIKTALNDYGKDLFKVTITKGKYEGNREQDYYDKPTLHRHVDSKYVPIDKLRTGEKNATMMVLLMNQGAFGPLIIDEPEQYLDVKSITGLLVHRMRQLKTRQQIICITRDEHILISGDAEQVIVTKAEDKLETFAGDINNEDVQEQVIEIFEGDRLSMLAKTRKLERILELLKE